jgi:hypothetical protein
MQSGIWYNGFWHISFALYRIIVQGIFSIKTRDLRLRRINMQNKRVITVIPGDGIGPE